MLRLRLKILKIENENTTHAQTQELRDIYPKKRRKIGKNNILGLHL
jgi:hypothetical protein